jgi:hypothetical protein
MKILIGRKNAEKLGLIYVNRKVEYMKCWKFPCTFSIFETDSKPCICLFKTMDKLCLVVTSYMLGFSYTIGGN